MRPANGYARHPPMETQQFLATSRFKLTLLNQNGGAAPLRSRIKNTSPLRFFGGGAIVAAHTSLRFFGGWGLSRRSTPTTCPAGARSDCAVRVTCVIARVLYTRATCVHAHRGSMVITFVTPQCRRGESRPHHVRAMSFVCAST